MGREILDSSVLDDYCRVMGDQGEGFVRDLVKAFINDTNGLCELLFDAWQQKDLKAFQRAAHSMKTTSKTMGALHLSHQFESLEGKASQGDMSDEALFLETLASLDKARQELALIYLS